jgi:TM2 domain-containing membrane protein YozV
MSEQQVKGPDEMFCSSCGAIIKKEAEICPKCGVRLKPAPYYTGSGEGKDWLTTLLLCIFLGWLGIHRFYSGSTGIGVVQLLTLGGCGIWALIDMIMIVVGSYKDGDGNPLVRKF